MDLTPKEFEALKTIKFLLACNGKMPSIRELMRAMNYNSPRSASFLVDRLVSKGFLEKSNKKIKLSESKKKYIANTINIPLLGSVNCGTPIEEEQNIETYISISTNIARPGYKYFLLHVKGDSMDKAGINDGDYILVRQQLDADNGDYVVALVDNESTVKELQKKQGFVSLVPRSSNHKHKPIILDADTFIQGVVITSIPKSIIEN